MPNFIAQTAAQTEIDTGLLTMISRMGPVAMGVLIVLVLFSVVSWAIIAVILWLALSWKKQGG